MLVVFDVDGVIVDSNSFWAHMASSLLESMNIIPEEGLDEKINSYSLQEGIDYMNKHYPITISQEIIESFCENYYLNEVKLKENTLNLIKKLYNKSMPMAILSSNNEKIIQIILNRFDLEKYFIHVYANANKHEISTYESIGKDEICLIDDSLYALECAKKANWKVIGEYDPDSFEDPKKIKNVTNYKKENFENENSFNNCR